MVQRFSHLSHANDTDVPTWGQSCHDHRLASGCVPTDGGGVQPRALASGDLRLWFELRDRTSSREMRTVGGKIPEECAVRTPRHGDKSSARLTDRCRCNGASAGVRWNSSFCPSLVIRCGVRRLFCPSGPPPFGMNSTPLKPVTGTRGRSGQLRPYVRPASQHLPLAIMGVRVRVRRQSEERARGTQPLNGIA
jgi:hypothetical protein